MKKQKKCYIYTRVSTAIQVDGYSLDAQKDKLRKYAEYQYMTIVSEFSDEGFSGKNIKGRINTRDTTITARIRSERPAINVHSDSISSRPR